MSETLKILIVDDHPLIVDAYKNILLSSKIDREFIIETANDCDSAIKVLNRKPKTEPFDLLFFDIKLPASADGKIISGEELAVFAKKKMPGAKIIILTMFNENHRINNILKSVNPDGLLIKNDLSASEFLNAVKAVLNNPPYYSSTVARYFRNQTMNHDDSLLDDVNRRIIYFISKGIKTKNLVNHINLSLSAIEKRKIQIKNLMALENANDEELIKEAQKRGFI